jgi:hypothetical protein
MLGRGIPPLRTERVRVGQPRFAWGRVATLPTSRNPLDVAANLHHVAVQPKYPRLAPKDRARTWGTHR